MVGWGGRLMEGWVEALVKGVAFGMKKSDLVFLGNVLGRIETRVLACPDCKAPNNSYKDGESCAIY